MFQTILVPTDFSKTSRHALDIAVGIALLDQGQIHLLHVIETIPHLAFEELKNFYTSLEAHAGQELETLQTLYRNRPV